MSSRLISKPGSRREKNGTRRKRNTGSLRTASFNKRRQSLPRVKKNGRKNAIDSNNFNGLRSMRRESNCRLREPCGKRSESAFATSIYSNFRLKEISLTRRKRRFSLKKISMDLRLQTKSWTSELMEIDKKMLLSKLRRLRLIQMAAINVLTRSAQSLQTSRE